MTSFPPDFFFPRWNFSLQTSKRFRCHRQKLTKTQLSVTKWSLSGRWTQLDPQQCRLLAHINKMEEWKQNEVTDIIIHFIWQHFYNEKHIWILYSLNTVGLIDGESKSLEDAWLSSSVVESENRGSNCLSGLIWVNLNPTNKVTHLQHRNPPESRPGWK